MKTIFSKLLFVGAFSLFLSTGFAQSAASSREVGVDTSLSASSTANQTRIQAEKEAAKAEADRIFLLSHRSTIPIPQNIITLFQKKKEAEAFKQFEAYKASLKDEDPMQVLLLETEIYNIAIGENPEKEKVLGDKREAIIENLKKTYGDQAQVIRFQLDRVSFTAYDSIIDIATRIIKADSTFLPAYEKRGDAFYRMGKMKEACEDYSKLPQTYRNMLPESWKCREALQKQEEQETKE